MSLKYDEKKGQLAVFVKPTTACTCKFEEWHDSIPKTFCNLNFQLNHPNRSPLN